MTAVLLALAAGCGGALRYALDIRLARLRVAQVPMATALINVTGSFALGLLTGLAMALTRTGLPGSALPGWLVITGTGFLGGFTTLGTASVETARLLAGGRIRAGLTYGLGMMLTALAAAALGVLIGWLLAG
ncbi:fluoride efflux transporter FluC [Brevibacterium luteolum]|uniref:Fluoride-specific ion channel FluC n=1 Tax=Brevibacterium luteolum TaxID=199591 RepID=A0A849ASE5_9MICO|nr:CrcB family protein [Brevibacterium luteolum]MBM7529577.1 CrcB protein [Brevibacterium luteolum]NNG79583.1 hypothetical protein [Brevibacterium luteolum]